MKMSSSNLSISDLNCPNSCNSLSLNIGSSNHRTTRTLTEQYLYFPARVILNQENYLYLFLAMAAEIGI
jgi:hypothetical protein